MSLLRCCHWQRWTWQRGVPAPAATAHPASSDCCSEHCRHRCWAVPTAGEVLRTAGGPRHPRPRCPGHTVPLLLSCHCPSALNHGQLVHGCFCTPTCLLEIACVSESTQWGVRAAGGPLHCGERGASTALWLPGTRAAGAKGPGRALLRSGEPRARGEERDQPRAPGPLTQCSLPSLAAAERRGRGSSCQPRGSLGQRPPCR